MGRSPAGSLLPRTPGTRVFDFGSHATQPAMTTQNWLFGALEIGENRAPEIGRCGAVTPSCDQGGPAGYAVFVVQEQEGKPVARCGRSNSGRPWAI